MVKDIAWCIISIFIMHYDVCYLLLITIKTVLADWRISLNVCNAVIWIIVIIQHLLIIN